MECQCHRRPRRLLRPLKYGGFVLAVAGVGLFAGSTAFGQDAGVASSSAGVAASELKPGTELTQRGSLAEAIPHLLAARAGGVNIYVSSFNLAICYLGTGAYKDAIATLEALRSSGRDTAAVNNLLAQAYLGAGDTAQGWAAFARAAAQTPEDEKLYDFVADACTDHQQYALGLRVAEAGIEKLPGSARLHYERALFLARLDRLGEARPEFERAAALASGSYIASLARVQEDLYGDNYPEAIGLLRAAIEADNKAGRQDARLLSLLGTVLLREAPAPGEAEFLEARAALEEAARLRPGDAAAQIALGKVYLLEGRTGEAVEHLELGRRLEPNNAEAYANLAHAYLKLGEREKARACQAELRRLASSSAGRSSP